MPVIPVYKRQVSIPGGGANALGDVNSAGIVGKALEQGGNQIFNQYDQILQKQREEKDQIDKIKYTTDYSNLLNEYEIDKRSNEQGELAIGITNRSVTNLESMANDFLEKNIPERIRPQMGAILKQLNDRSLDKFTTFEIHQREVYRGQTAKNAIETAAGQIASLANSPMDINNTLADTIAKLESLKVPQFEIDKASSGLISIAIETNANNGNFKEAESLINEHRELLDAHGVRDTMVNMIATKEKQAKLLGEKMQEDYAVTVNKEFQNKFLSGGLNATDVLNSTLDPKSKNEWLADLNRAPVSFKTDKDFELKLWTKIMNDPESISERQIMQFAGHGLSREDAQGFINLRDKQISGDPEKKVKIKEVLDNFKLDKATGVFGPPKNNSANVEYLTQIDAFKRWVKAHPNDDPAIYYDKVMSNRKMNAVQEILDYIPFIDPWKPNPKKAREDMEAAGEIPAKRGTANNPPVNAQSNETKIRADLKAHNMNDQQINEYISKAKALGKL